jgi:hypothetical protein
MPEKPPPKPLALVGTPAAPGTTAIPPPKTLGAAGRTLWRSIQAEFSITDSGGYAVLTVACEALDRADGLRKCINEDGEVIALHAELRACAGSKGLFSQSTQRPHGSTRLLGLRSGEKCVVWAPREREDWSAALLSALRVPCPPQAHSNALPYEVKTSAPLRSWSLRRTTYIDGHSLRILK